MIQLAIRHTRNSLILCALFVIQLSQLSVSISCPTDKTVMGKCNISISECEQLRCVFPTTPSNDWADQYCVACREPPGTKIIWTMSNHTEMTLPPNMCIKSSGDGSYLVLPRCFMNKELNEGRYSCKTVNTSNNHVMNSESFDMIVSNRLSISWEYYNGLVKLYCPYSFCIEQLNWTFSKTQYGSYGPLPHGTYVRHHMLFGLRMTKNLEGFYKCSVKSKSLDDVSKIISLKMHEASVNKPSFICNHVLQNCASEGNPYIFTCQGNISNPKYFNSALITLSCPTLKNHISNLSKTYFQDYIRNDETFRHEYDFLEFIGTASNNSFEIKVQMRYVHGLSENITCSLTLDEGTSDTEFKEFSICFIEKKFPAIYIIIPITTVAIIVILLILFTNFEYEIRLFLHRHCSLSTYRSQSSGPPKVLLVYASERNSTADSVKDYLNSKFQFLEVEKLWDAIPGEDMGNYFANEIMSATIVLILLEHAAFNQQPSLYEDAIKTSFENKHIQRMYLLLDGTKFSPPTTFKGGKHLEADMNKFWSRDRTVTCTKPFENNLTCQSNLQKKLRYLLEKRFPKKSGSMKTTQSKISLMRSSDSDFVPKGEMKLDAITSVQIPE